MLMLLCQIKLRLSSSCQINLYHAVLDAQWILFQLAAGRAQAFAGAAVEHPVVKLAGDDATIEGTPQRYVLMWASALKRFQFAIIWPDQHHFAIVGAECGKFAFHQVFMFA